MKALSFVFETVIALALVTTVLAPAFADGGSSTVGPAHPSAKNCLERGGINAIVDVDYFGGPQMSTCRLSDNSVVETMTYWMQKSSETKAFEHFRKARWHVYDNLPIESWASKNCTDLGGEIVTVAMHLQPGVRFQLCRFQDRSAIEAWTLFAGPSYYPKLLN